VVPQWARETKVSDNLKSQIQELKAMNSKLMKALEEEQAKRV
jgi:hypothetical protein